MDEPFVRVLASNLIEDAARLCPGFYSRRSGYVYGLEVAPGLVKVGMTRNPSGRFVGIRNDPSRPCDATLGGAVVSRACSNFVELESRVHGILGGLRVRGEYFRCTLGDVEVAFRGLEYRDCIDADSGPLTFRDHPKETFRASIPRELIDAVKYRAIIEHRSFNEVFTEILCRGLGLDPADFAIGVAAQHSRETSVSTN